MKLSTYLSFSEVIVASLVLIFSCSGYQWHLTTNEQHLAAPKNNEVYQITFDKGFQCQPFAVTFWDLKNKRVEGIISQFGAQVSSKTCLKL